jgi:hypothetical protein
MYHLAVGTHGDEDRYRARQDISECHDVRDAQERDRPPEYAPAVDGHACPHGVSRARRKPSTWVHDSVRTTRPRNGSLPHSAWVSHYVEQEACAGAERAGNETRR